MTIVTDGLVSEWVAKLATGSGPGVNSPTETTTWVDLVGDHDGAVSGFSYSDTDGWDGTGTSGDPYNLVSDRTGGMVVLTDHADFKDGSFSVELWMHMNATDATNNQVVFDNRHDNTITNGHWFVLVGPTYTFPSLGYRDASNVSRYLANGGVDLTDGWNHVVYTHDGTDSKEYVEGEYVAGRDGDGITVRTGSTNPRMFMTSGGTFAFNGAIATMRYYNRALGVEEVAANYAAGVTAASTDSSATFLPHVMTHHFYPPLIGGR
jgi:hypothetical protein